MARNKSYLSDVLLPIAMAKFQNYSNAKCELLSDLLQMLQNKNQPPKPKPRSIYKTDVI